MNEPVLGFLGIAVGAIFAYLASRFTARQSTKAAALTAQTNAANTARQVDVTEWTALVAALQSQLQILTARVAALEAKGEGDRSRIDSLEQELAARDVRYHALVLYVREVLAWSRTIPHASPPPIPMLFADELA
jgi:hypothetical protein